MAIFGGLLILASTLLVTVGEAVGVEVVDSDSDAAETRNDNLAS